jgi:2-C-methyl-D-erythritol 4-phosphate cytidylyltransferase
MSIAGHRVAVVLLAAGSGTRVGQATNKVLLPLAGVPVLVWSLRAVERLGYVDQVVVVHRDADRAVIEAALRQHPARHQPQLVTGGETRHASEWHALQHLAGPIDAGTIDVVAIHDTARPLAGPDLFEVVIATAAEHGGALPVRVLTGVISRDELGAAGARPAGSTGTADLVAVQTPQAFRAAPLLEAYRRADRDGFEGTDTAACIERFTDLEIRGVPAPATNLKITFPEDVAVAERLLSGP